MLNPFFGHQPGAKRFLHYLVVIIVFILSVIFLWYTDRLEQDIELVVIEKTLSEINTSLSVSTLVDYVAKGKLEELQFFHRGNPFVFLAVNYRLPSNYFGTVKTLEEINRQGGWYFDMTGQQVVYQSANNLGRFYYELVFQYEDNNGSGRFEKTVDELTGFYLKKKPSEKSEGS